MKNYDCVVIGSGPCGMTAALYLCRFGLRTALVEKLAPGGQMLSTFAIENYPGFPLGLSGWSLADNISAHLNSYQIDRYNRTVSLVTQPDGKYLIRLDDEEIAAETVIVCSGAVSKKLGIPGEDRLIGRGVSYCAMCDGNFFKNKTVAVVGGGNSALDEALHLIHIVKKLYLIHRRERFRADQIYQDKLAACKCDIEVLSEQVVVELFGEEKLTGLAVRPFSGGESNRLDVDGLFVFIGVDPVVDFLDDGVERDGRGFIVTDAEMRTNVPGLFAAGDVRSKRCRQVVTAVGDGATAAFSAFSYLGR